MSARERKKKPVLHPGIAIVTVFCIMFFSLAVRWLGIGRSYPREGATFRIEVLNGTGETGLAMKTAMEIREMGIDVLIVGDAESYDFKESLLIDRRGNPQLMKRLSQLLGCRRVLVQVQEHPIVDATFIIGEDRGSLKIGRGNY